MRKPLEQCPACGGEMIITQQTCTTCHTMVVGQFQPNIFSRLSPENLRFIEIFVKNRGNVKDMERELGWSYWAIRKHLDEVLGELGFAADSPAVAPAGDGQRQEILTRLAAGELTVPAAAEALAALRNR